MVYLSIILWLQPFGIILDILFINFTMNLLNMLLRIGPYLYFAMSSKQGRVWLQLLLHLRPDFSV